MALSDDHPIRIVSPDYKTSAQSDLAQWLMKEAAEGSKLDTNEDKAIEGRGDLYEAPAKPPVLTDAVHVLTNEHARAQRERRDVAGRAFNTAAAAERADQALLSANFDHVRSGDFTARSLLLQSKTKEASTLSDMVDRLGLRRD